MPQNITISTIRNNNPYSWLFLLLLFLAIETTAQISEISDTVVNQDIERIRWVAEFPSETDSGNKRGVFLRVSDSDYDKVTKIYESLGHN